MLKYEGGRGNTFNELIVKEYLSDEKGEREQIIQFVWHKTKDEAYLEVFEGHGLHGQYFVCSREKMKEILKELQETIDDK